MVLNYLYSKTFQEKVTSEEDYISSKDNKLSDLKELLEMEE